MSQTQALVETLTAEVRVLMVGNRQITLSVARQLDSVPLADLQIMGRVKIGSELRHVIGSAPDGTLAVAQYKERWYPTPRYVDAEDLTGTVSVCRSLKTHREGYYSLAIQGESFYLNTEATEECAVPEHSKWQGAQKCDGWTTTPEVMDQIRAAVATRIRDEIAAAALNKAAAAAPLIVLAGLK